MGGAEGHARRTRFGRPHDGTCFQQARHPIAGPDPMDQLRYEVERRDDEVHVRLRGVLDLASRPTFVELADDLIGRAAERDTGTGVLIDLADLDFLDSTGIVELIRAARRAEGSGVPLRFIGPAGGAARRSADVVGLSRILRWDDPEPV